MALNDEVNYISGDITHDQLAPSQAARTEFTPGKANSRPNDQNWPTEFRIPTGTPAFDGEAAGPVEMTRNRFVKVGRNIVGDQVINEPIKGTPVTTVIDNQSAWGTGNIPEYTLTPTETEQVDIAGHQRDKENIEHVESVDNIKGA
jgi:hypothetical protein